MISNPVISPYGHYIYGDHSFYSREEALQFLLQTEQYDGTFRFYYHDHVFGSYDWTKEIELNISHLYRYRAQQLRDKYKYLILTFSGGSDSTQMLMTFIKNKIHIDEIQVYHHEKSVSKLDKHMMLGDTELSQFMEYQFAVEPFLKKYADHLKNTKINLIDSSDFVHEQYEKNKFDMLGTNARGLKSSCFIVPKMVRSFQYHMLSYNEKVIDKDNVGLIRGTEKPTLTIIDDRLFFQFYDIAYQTVSNFYTKKVDNFTTIENFYWSPDVPLIPIKQSHLIKKRLETDNFFYEKYVSMRSKRIEDDFMVGTGFSDGGDLERMFSSIIYPDWNPTTFVAPKPKQVNPEFKLYDTLGVKHFGRDIMKELKEFNRAKYDKITFKNAISSFIYSRRYPVGKLLGR